MPAHRAESPLTCVAVGSGPLARGVRGDPPLEPQQQSRTTAGPGDDERNHLGDIFRMYDKAVRRRRAVLAVLVAPLADPAHRLLRRVQRPAACTASSAARWRCSRRSRRAPTASLKPFRDLFGWFGDTLDAKDERDKLETERDAAARRRSPTLQVDGAENEQLRGLLDINTGGGMKAYEPVIARVFARSPSTWYSTVEINKGSSDGVQARPARGQRRRPGRQGQVGLRRQRDRDAAHRPGVRRLRQGRPRPASRARSTPPSARPATCCSSSSRTARTSSKGERIVTAGTRLDAAAARCFPPGILIGTVNARRRGRGRARPPHPRPARRRPAPARVSSRC